MKSYAFLLIVMTGMTPLYAQKNVIDSLKTALSRTTTDSARLEILNDIGIRYKKLPQLDSAIQYQQEALEVVQKGRFAPIREVWQLAALDNLANITDNYTLSMQYAQRQLLLSRQMKDNLQIAYSLCGIATVYVGLGDLRKALDQYFQAKKVFELFESGHLAIQNIAELYQKLHMPDSALFFNRVAYHIADTGHNQQYMKDFAIRVFGDIFSEKGESGLALSYYRQFIRDFYQYDLNNREIGMVYLAVAGIFKEEKKMDSAVYYARLSLEAAKKYQDQQRIKEAATFLYTIYTILNKEHEAFGYYRLASEEADSLLTTEKVRQVQNLAFNERIRDKEQAESSVRAARQRAIIITTSSIVVAIITFLLWYRIRQLRLKHQMVLEKKETEKLKAIDKMKEKFFTNITHELRTPLSLIMSPAAFYLEHPEELYDTPTLLKSIYKQSGYLLDLINQLLDISKLDAGKMSISLSKGNFASFVTELVRAFEEQADQKGISIHMATALPGEYLFDPDHWKKIVNNLVANAIKFTPAHGEIFLDIKKITGSSSDSTIRLSVSDNGIGIPSDQLPFITDRFYQADNNLTRKYEGAGIGLALVNELVKLMGGTLEIDSEPGKGSVFSITITLLSAEGKKGFPEVGLPEAAARFVNEGAAISSPEKLTRDNTLTILIAEDNVALSNFLRSSIEPFYNVITAPDGAKAFELTLAHMPDIIISDVMMPVMDGSEFCGKIKANPATSHIPFIILSAKATMEDRIAGLDKGADDYLIKPFSVDELLSRVRNMAGRSREHKQKKAEMERQLLDLEAKALRAQMNPHFIFNCMNSIKALIQQKEEDKAITYLTTFSKLIRTIFQNSDKREISLYDEIETCRLYTQLESMRFGNKFNYVFSIDNSIDLKSLLVPALIIQPFIENAIWHGIMPKEQGGSVNLTVKREDENICCIIDDNGIGREMSRQNKFTTEASTHQSKGVHLTQSRLDLNNLLNARNASITITDKKDDKGKATGTSVILLFSEFES